MKRRAIILNRMYAGDYLSNNIGHEVINMYAADNGEHYLYLNATGDYAKEHEGCIKLMLLVKYHSECIVELLAKADIEIDVFKPSNKEKECDRRELLPSQVEFIQNEGGIYYGGVSINDIFTGRGQQNVNITFKAKTDSFFVPNEGKRVFIKFAPRKDTNINAIQNIVDNLRNEGHTVIEINGYRQSNTNLYQIIYPEGTYKGDGTLAKEENKDAVIEKRQNDFANLEEAVNEALTVMSNQKVILPEGFKPRKLSFFDICRKQNDENAFSDALKYFMEKYPELWRKFFQSKFNINLDTEYDITREEDAKLEDSTLLTGGRIDITIRDNKHTIVIENKIKSDINKKDGDTTSGQLRRYYNYINHNDQDKGKEPTFILLCPQYNIPTIEIEPNEKVQMKNVWKILTYKELYEFLEQNLSVFQHDSNFVEFFEAMKRHTYANVNDYLYHEMQEKFIMRTYEVLNS